MILEQISQYCANKIAIQTFSLKSEENITYGELIEHIQQLKDYFINNNIKSVAFI